VGDVGDILRKKPTTQSLGKENTCANEVFITNCNRNSNLTHIKVYDNSATSYTDIFPATSFPVRLFPSSMNTNDATYFGSSPEVEGGGRFSSLVFDISTIIDLYNSYNATLTWQYWNGATWASLDVQDNTKYSGFFNNAFTKSGVNSLHWEIPSDWTTTTVDGVEAYWVRIFVQSPPVSSTVWQDNQDIYTVVNGFVDIDSSEVSGDVPALVQYLFYNQSDKDGLGGDNPNLTFNRIVAGTRSLSRGNDFSAYLNLSEIQNPEGVYITVGNDTTISADVNFPTGRRVTYSAPATTSDFEDRTIINLKSSISSQFFGDFRVFLRGKHHSGTPGEIEVRLQVRTGTGGITNNSDNVSFQTKNIFEVLDLGKIHLPASTLFKSGDTPDETQISIQAKNTSTNANVIYFYDLILIPVDEFAIDAIDRAREEDSGVGRRNNITHWLDIDSITDPRTTTKTFVRKQNNDIQSVYQTIAKCDAVLKPYNNQRLWVFFLNYYVSSGTHTGANNASVLTDISADFANEGVEVGMTVVNETDGSQGIITAVTATTITATLTGGTDNDWDTNDVYYILTDKWQAKPEITCSIQAFKNERYLSMRGVS